MKTTRTMMRMPAVLVVGAVLLTTTAAATAAPGGRGRDSGPSSRSGGSYDHRSDRDRGGDRHYNPRVDRHDNRSNLGVRIEFGDRPTVQTVQRWVPGYWTTVTEQVLIEPARNEARWVESITETRYPSNGPPYTVVIRPGGWQTVCIPARYETRATQVWVPGHYECVPVVTSHSGPRISIGGVIVF